MTETTNTNPMDKTYKFRGEIMTLTQIREILLSEDQTYGYDRQHGKKGISLDDLAKDTRRLMFNEASRRHRKKVRDIDEYTDEEFKRFYGIVEDKYGIRPVDERRYKACFKSAPIGSRVQRSYVKMMTGLSLKQMLIMQQRTKLIPHPPVSDKEAADEEKLKYETGDYYL